MWKTTLALVLAASHLLVSTQVVALSTMPKVKHVVMFTVQDGVSEEAVEAMKSGLLGLPKVLPEIASHELGEDLKLTGGQNHPAGKNRSVVWSATFRSVDDYETYETSKEHVDVVTTLIKPIIVPGSRAAIQYNID
mmetsp:Transcript_2485/g.6625  ORF Transcript_2485/g.6625 Transcript_2485/m.6625 type:complete len:136 (+) Transcript_2485:61-468(+)